MRHAISLFAILLLVLPGCGKKDDSDKGVRVFIPPPTKIRFYKSTAHGTTSVGKQGVRFKVRDSKNNRDTFGDDEPSLVDAISIPKNTVGDTFGIYVPTHRRTKDVHDELAQVDVNNDYKTIEVVLDGTIDVPAQSGNPAKSYPFSITINVSDAAKDDIFDQTMKVVVQDFVDSAKKKTRLTLTVDYKRSGKLAGSLSKSATILYLY